MAKFTEKIVSVMKSEGLFESQGGPIILSQVALNHFRFCCIGLLANVTRQTGEIDIKYCTSLLMHFPVLPCFVPDLSRSKMNMVHLRIITVVV